VFLINGSSRTIAVQIKRSNNVDKHISVFNDTINPSQNTPQGLPWVGAHRTSPLHIGCQFDGSRVYTYEVLRADYK
jgi:hypothetical protein